MGLFGKKKDELPVAGGGYATQPGAIPVATPVPMEETTYHLQETAPPNAVIVEHQQQQKAWPATTVVESPPTYSKTTTTTATNPTLANSGMQGGGGGFFVDQNDPTLARGPMMMRQCPNCQQESRTHVKTFPSWQTWAASGVLCFVFWPIFWVPLVLDNCKETEHYCVTCGAQVGKVGPFADCCVTRRA